MAGPGVVHVVLFEFKSKATDEQVKDVIHLIATTTIRANRRKACDRMLGLAQACVHPDTEAPYIKTSVGGKNNSIEGMEVCLVYVPLPSNLIRRRVASLMASSSTLPTSRIAITM